MEGIYPLHTSLSPPLMPSGRHAVTLSRCHALTIPHSRNRELRNTHKPENPAGKPDSKTPPEATSRTQSAHKPDDSNLDLGFPQRGKAYGSTCGQPPLRGVEAPQPSRDRALSQAAAKKAQAWRNQCARHRRRAADPRPTRVPFGNPHPSFRAGPPSADRRPSDMNP